MADKLAGFVHVNGQVYGPDDEVPAEVAKQITNPKAWATSPAKGDAKAEAKPKPTASKS